MLSLVYVTINQITYLDPSFPSYYSLSHFSICISFLFSCKISVWVYNHCQSFTVQKKDGDEEVSLCLLCLWWAVAPLYDHTSVLTVFSMYFHTSVTFKQKGIHSCDTYWQNWFAEYSIICHPASDRSVPSAHKSEVMLAEHLVFLEKNCTTYFKRWKFKPLFSLMVIFIFGICTKPLI